MGSEILSTRALDVLNRAGKIKSDVDFCGQNGDLPKEMRRFMRWLGDHIRTELQREDWEEPEPELEDGEVVLYMFPRTWRLRCDDYVAFAFWWPKLFEEPPCVMLYVPAADVFPPRNELVKQLRPRIKRAGFTDDYERCDPEPSCPIWKNIDLDQFQRESGFDLGTFVAVVVEDFRRLLEVEPLIDQAFQSLPIAPLTAPTERVLKTIAFLDTETQGSGTSRKMTELAIVNVAYDPEADVVVGVLEEYCKGHRQKLDAEKALRLLERAECIVAHNASADRPLVARELPGSEKLKWCCSFREIDWKQLLGVQSGSLQTLMGKSGLRYEQDHNARADAHDLKRLLAVKHKGRTYLGRLLDNGQVKG